MAEGGMKVTKIYNPGEKKECTDRLLRVAAYCRVSSKRDEQRSSYEGQMDAYRVRIAAEPGWTLAGLYADCGLSGTRAEKRPQFLQMIQDCEDGKIDAVICKSVSRFSRNTLDAVRYIQMLRGMGIRLIFEKENIDTEGEYSAMLLTVLAAFAQEESHSHSENVKWGKRKRAMAGNAPLYPPYGYTGDIILQKFLTEDHLSHKSVKNDSTEVPSYYIENHHLPIIPRKQYDRCMKIMGMRRVIGHKKEHDTGTCNQYPLGDKLRCPYCGSVLYQRAVPVQVRHGKGWVCEQGEDACHGFIIRSNLVEPALLEAYKGLDVAKIAEKVKSKRFGEAAKLTLEIRKEYPVMKRVDFWWVDDLIDHIEFGAHSRTEREYRRLVALGENVTDDRTMKVFWKCGLITTVMSGVDADREHPAMIADLYKSYLERQKEADEETEKEAETA
ncbi:MAG: recombinase family protein [Lachnospiraceae bacterium]|nr:recombinase family protein [Lachnospiraceae bacterium]